MTWRMRAAFPRTFPRLSPRPGLGRLSRAWVSGAEGVLTTMITFGDHGRAFDALVYFGGRPSAEMREEAASVLAGIRAGPTGVFA